VFVILKNEQVDDRSAVMTDEYLNS